MILKKLKKTVYIFILFSLIFSDFLIPVNQAKAADEKIITVTFKTAPTPSSVSVVKAPVKYNKKFAFSYTFDDGYIEGYNPAFRYMHGGYVSELGETVGGLYYTDGAGYRIPFKGAFNWISNSSSSFGDLHINTPSNMTWDNLRETYALGWEPVNHGWTSRVTPTPADTIIDYPAENGGPRPLDYDYEVTQNTVRLQAELGTTIKHFGLPAGDSNYIPAALANGMKSISTGQPGSSDQGLMNVASILNLEQMQYKRKFFAETTELQDMKDYLDKISNDSTGGNNYWGVASSHRVRTPVNPPDNGNLSFDNFKDFMNYASDTYGVNGNDSMWMASAPEVYEYLVTKQKTSIETSLLGNILTITLDTSLVDNDLRRYALSLIINADAEIDSISYEEAEFTHHSENLTSGLINLDWGFVSLENDITRAETLVATAESSRTQVDVDTARTYVALLENGSEKNDFFDRLDVVVVKLKSWQVSFGYNSNSTGAWNEYNGSLATSTTLTLNDSDNTPSSVTVKIQQDFSAKSSSAGMTTGNNSGYFPDSYLAGMIRMYSASTNTIPGVVRLSGLDSNKKYKLVLMGSHSLVDGTLDKTKTVYSINSVEKELQTSLNTSEVVAYENISPDIDGNIDISVAKKFAHWGYGVLNALEISEERQYTLTYSAGSHGIISGNASQVVSGGSDGTEVIAIPNEGYHFVSWSDGILTAARTDLNIQANKSVTASFEANPVDTYTLSISTSGTGSGSVSGAGTYDSGSIVTLGAIPDANSSFVNWTGDPDCSDGSVTMNADVSCMATFNSIQSQGNPVKVFIMLGQSNMLGNGGLVSQAPEEWKPLEGVLYDETVPGTSGSASWEQIGTATTFMGPEMSFAATLRDSYPNDTIAILKVSQAATGLSYWSNPGSLGYDTLMARIDVIKDRLDESVLANEIPSWSFAGIISVQGENEADGALSGAQAYEVSFDNMINNILVKVDDFNLPVILARTSIKLDPSLGGPVDQPQLDLVRSQQVAWSANYASGAWVDTDDLMLIDNWHYGSYSQLVLGKRIAKAFFNIAENRPSLTITLAGGQSNKSNSATLSYKAVFSEPVNGFTQSDVLILGDTGANNVTIVELSPNNGTTYQIDITGMTYPGILDIDIPQGVANSINNSALNLVGIKENTKIIYSQHPGVNNLILYDPFSPSSRDLRNLSSGVGWDGKGWETQNNVSGYTSSSVTPLSYDGLLSSPAYATGGFSYQSSQRYLDLEKTFRPYMTSIGAGAIDVPGTVFWVSYLIKPKDISRAQRVSLLKGVSTSYSDSDNAVRVLQSNGKWSMGLLNNAPTESSVSLVANNTYLMVLRVEVGGPVNPSSVHLWINPDESILGGENPDLATATLSEQVTSSNFKFRRINWYPGIAENHGDIDEIRLGTTFSAVTPTNISAPSAPIIDTAIAGDAQATVTFSPPSSDGGSPITGYTVTSIPAGGVDTNAGETGLSHVITGLTNGTSYTFTVTATNLAGTSLASASSNSVTPQAQAAFNQNKGVWYSTIQGAINFASSSDVINVAAGTFYERLIIDKPITLNGDSATTTIINGQELGNPITVNSSDVSITNLKATNSHADSDAAGIRVNSGYSNFYLSDIDASGNTGSGIHVTSGTSTISNCITNDNIWGIRIDFSSNVIIDNCTVANNQRYDAEAGAYGQGIRVVSVASSTIINSRIFNNAREGILITESAGESENITIDDSLIYGNGVIVANGGVSILNANDIFIKNSTIRDNAGTGIRSGTSYNIEIDDNIIFGNSVNNIFFTTSNNSTIKNNNIGTSTPADNLRLDRSDNFEIFNNEIYSTGSDFYTLSLTGSGGNGSDNSNIYNNIIRNNANGIKIEQSSTGNNIRNNQIHNSTNYGMRIFSGSGISNIIKSNNIYDNKYGLRVNSDGNTFYDNRFANSNSNSYFSSGTNTWNISQSVGPNILGGTYYGGNYWSDYAGVDVNGDGFGDTTYTVVGVSDNLPLVSAYIQTYSLIYTAGENGTIAGTTTQVINYGGNGSSVTAVPNEGYHFVSWSDGVLTAARTDLNITENKSVTADFEVDIINTYNLSISTSGTGSGSVSGAGTYDSGSIVTLGGIPDTNSIFIGWTGEPDCSDGSVTMNANVSCAAVFNLKIFSLNYSASVGGSISGDNSQSINYGADGTPVTAVPSDGYRFLKWDDNSVSNPRTDTNLQFSSSYVAMFEVLPTSDIFFISPTPDNNDIIGQSSTTIRAELTNYLNRSGFIDFNNDLIGYWNSENINEAIISDDSQNNNNGTLSNGASLGSTEGIRGSYMIFDGLNQFVTIPYSSSLNVTSAFTVESWVKRGESQSSPWAQIVNRNGDNGFNLQHDSTNTRFEFAVRTNTGRYHISAAPAGGMQDNIWYHVAGVYNGSHIILYVDGVEIARRAHSGTVMQSNKPIYIGKRSDNNVINDRYFKGKIDEVKYWNRALTEQEIKNSHTLNSNNFSSTYSNLSSANYNYRACNIDSAGIYNCTDIRSLAVNLEPLEITINSPQHKTYITNDINFDITLNKSVESCSYSLGGGQNILMDRLSSLHFQHLASDLDEGPLDLNITCQDYEGGTISKNMSFAVDTIPPAIDLENPISTTYFNSDQITFNFTPYKTGVGTISECKLFIGSPNDIFNQSDPGSYVWQNPPNSERLTLTQVVAEGAHKWNVWCRDSGDNSDWSQLGDQNFVVDLTSPYFINIPPDSTIEQGAPWSGVTFSATDIVQFSEYYLVTPVAGFSIDNAGFLKNDNILDLGIYNIEVGIRDSAGNANSAIYTLSVTDTKGPDILINSPINTTYNSRSQLLEIDVFDNSGSVSSIWYNWNGEDVLYDDATTILFNEGVNTIIVWAQDGFSNISSSTVSFTINSLVAPAAPTIGTATAGNAQATVTFSAPSSDGGSPITGYTVTSIPAGGVDTNAGETGLSHVITGLTNGTSYTFTVTATNLAGTSLASASSNSVTPMPPTVYYALEYSTNGLGSITGLSSQLIAHGGGGEEVIAVPNTGHRFVRWSDNSTANPRTDININANISVSAIFEKIASGNGNISLPPGIGYGSRDATISAGNILGSIVNVGPVDNSGVNVLTYITNQNKFIAPQSSNNWQPNNHHFVINNLNLNSNIVTLIFYSEPKIITLAKGETKDLDLDGDSINDIKVTFTDVYVNRAEITIKSLAGTDIKEVPLLDGLNLKEVMDRERSLVKKTNSNLVNRLNGRILLQVEERGQAWYLESITKEKYFMGRADDAFSLMRKFGLGISNGNLDKFLATKAPSKFSGRIFLAVERNGEAYYVNPVDLKLHYLGRPADAYQLMRDLALGITNDNIRQIPVAKIE